MIVNNKVSIKPYCFEPNKGSWCWGEGERLYVLKNYLDNMILQGYSLPNIDFLVSSREELHVTWIRSYLNYMGVNSDKYLKEEEKYINLLEKMPIFLFSKSLDDRIEKNKFLLPDSYIMDQKLYLESLKSTAFGSFVSNWSQKVPLAHFRGAPSGIAYEADVYSNISKFFPRLNLVYLSTQYPDYIDAKFSSWFKIGDDSESTKKLKELNINKDNALAPYTSIEDQLAYKYILSLDGYKCAWIRVPWIMVSNSVLMKTETDQVEWFYNKIIPDVHYVSIKADLSNLVHKVQYLRENDTYAKNIAENASEFIIKNLLPENIQHDILSILSDYSEVQELSLGFVDEFLTHGLVLLDEIHKTTDL